MSSVGTFNKSAQSGQVSKSTITFNDNVQEYGKLTTNKIENKSVQDTIDFDMMVEQNEDHNRLEELRLKNEREKIVKNLAKFMKSGFMKFGNTYTSVLLSLNDGAIKLTERIGDGVLWTAKWVGYLYSKPVGGVISWFNKDAADKWAELNDQAVDKLEEAIAYEWRNGLRDAIKDSDFGKIMNSNTALEYGGETSVKVADVSEKVQKVVGQALASKVWGGWLAFALGANYGSGERAEKLYQENRDTTNLQEGGILLTGALTGLSWKSTGTLTAKGASIVKDIFSEGGKDILVGMGKEMLTKEFWKNGLKKGLSVVKDGKFNLNAVMNYVSSAMSTGEHVTPYINGEKEFNETEALKIGAQYVKYLGINVAEDMFKDYITDFDANKYTELANEIQPAPVSAVSGIEVTEPLPTRTTLPLTAPISTRKTLSLEEYNTIRNFRSIRYIPQDYYFTDEGKKLLEAEQLLKKYSFDEINQAYPGLFKHEGEYINLLFTVDTSYKNSIINIINSGETHISRDQYDAITSYILDRQSYKSVTLDEIKYLRQLQQTGAYIMNDEYKTVYQELNKIIDLNDNDEEIRQRLMAFAGAYVPQGKIDTINGSFEYEVGSEFARNAPNPNWAGYNNGQRSVINLAYAIDEINDIKSHESVHQISHNIRFDTVTGHKVYMAGVEAYRWNGTEWVSQRMGLNESLTELFHQLSHGEGYKKSFTSAYQGGVDALETMIDNKMIDLEDLKRCYFMSDEVGIDRVFETLASKTPDATTGQDLIKAFDKAIDSKDYNVRSEGIRELNKFIKDYSKSTKGSEVKGIFGLLKNIFK